MQNQKRYIITGGPGSGKTSIINYIAQMGYAVMAESATEIIEKDIQKGIDKPWRANDYHSRVAALNKEKQLHAATLNEPIVFFDRGHLDGITYILLQKRELKQDVKDFVESSMIFFETTVFFIENLDHCAQDVNRTETLEESQEKAFHLEHNYRKLGYNVIKIPIGTVKQRTKKLLDLVKNN